MPPEQQSRRSDGEWIAETRRRVEESVEMRLMSDVPLGMFLSGGVDSSAIAAMIRRKGRWSREKPFPWATRKRLTAN